MDGSLSCGFLGLLSPAGPSHSPQPCGQPGTQATTLAWKGCCSGGRRNLFNPKEYWQLTIMAHIVIIMDHVLLSPAMWSRFLFNSPCLLMVFFFPSSGKELLLPGLLNLKSELSSRQVQLSHRVPLERRPLGRCRSCPRKKQGDQRFA